MMSPLCFQLISRCLQVPFLFQAHCSLLAAITSITVVIICATPKTCDTPPLTDTSSSPWLLEMNRGSAQACRHSGVSKGSYYHQYLDKHVDPTFVRTRGCLHAVRQIVLQNPNACTPSRQRYPIWTKLN